jgi:YbgC/YbaW family acyl-CoA thioester hydrolase
MFSYTRTIFLRETDATGVLYFSEQLKLGLEVFEAYLRIQGFTLQQMLEKGDFLLPIVHAEADFSAPVRVGDEVQIELLLTDVGESSFTLSTKIFKDNLDVGTTKIIHVAVSRKTGKSIPIPGDILDYFRALERQ